VGAIVSHFFASLQSSFMVVEGFIYLSLLACYLSSVSIQEWGSKLREN
jgi:hypothetical protein